MTNAENCSTRLHVMIRPSTKELLTLAADEEQMSEAELVRRILEQRLPQLLRELGALPASYTKRTRVLADTASRGRRRDEMQPRPAVPDLMGALRDSLDKDGWRTPVTRSEAGHRESLEAMVEAQLISSEVADQLDAARGAVDGTSRAAECGYEWRRYPSDGFQRHTPTGPVE